MNQETEYKVHLDYDLTRHSAAGDVTDPEVNVLQRCCCCGPADIPSKSSAVIVVFVLVVVYSLRRHHERGTRGETVRVQDDREQRAWNEGSSDGPRHGETPPVGAAAGSADRTGLLEPEPVRQLEQIRTRQLAQIR